MGMILLPISQFSKVGTWGNWNIEGRIFGFIMCKKQTMDNKSFYKEMQNDPRSTDEYIF